MLSLRIFKVFITILLAILVSFTGWVHFSPRPTTWLVHNLFKNGMAVKPPNYNEIEETVSTIKDLIYPSNHKDNLLDMHFPKDVKDKIPVIFWIHGGAYVGGDKKDVTEYAIQIASHGFAVVNINYELAPSATYPGPIIQLTEAYQYITEIAADYPFDLDQIFFAGDSAGAQIASQFVNIQVDSQYAKLLKQIAVVPAHSIQGTLLFCGPYDFSNITEKSNNPVINYLFTRIAWSYIGEKKWQEHEQLPYANMLEYVSPNFPATFITDGTEMTFTEDGMTMADKLESLNIPVVRQFFEDGSELPHEYQFMMNRPEAIETFEKVIAFLQTRSHK
ncbi:acetyl esterase/lipase [Lysinibacillus parviboronicapiens]|uniref:Acetyl esterase/lipase n=1 Tax=Lysinibacillus parviboronicapiens TaxID=436516 RepID=A0ABV2PKF4_9BACI